MERTLKTAILLLLAAAGAAGGDEPVDLGKVLRESKEFRAQCEKYKITFADGVVAAVGEIAYRGGGPCEYLVNVYPNKGHETIVLLDDGPWDRKERRPRRNVDGLATNLNNAFLAAGFKPGKPFDMDEQTGALSPPKGETVHVYAEWRDDESNAHRAPMHEWVWNYKRNAVMEGGRFVYTGSVVYDDPDDASRKWLGAEMDGLVVAILTTRSSIVDHTEDGGMENGAYEAIPPRIPPSGTRVKLVISRKPMESTETYAPLEPPQAAEEEGEPFLPPEPKPDPKKGAEDPPK